MNSNAPAPTPAAGDRLPPGEGTGSSGEGAGTALEALIRKRRQGENAEPPEAAPPLPPPA
jgi:hypothetical protein